MLLSDLFVQLHFRRMFFSSVIAVDTSLAYCPECKIVDADQVC